ncbi:MAG: sulfotransferase [Pseudomonadota bacterium]
MTVTSKLKGLVEPLLRASVPSQDAKPLGTPTRPPADAYLDDDRRPPFFIIGCVRSGTTLLRDVIASHPQLFCPNETHFFRYAEAYGTLAYITPFMNRKIFKNHRDLDSISEEQFRDEILLKSHSRGELMRRYADAYLSAQNAPAGARWFDKTPQNVYGAFLIAHQFPEARFIHIVRNPLNVIASLKGSEVMTVKQIVGAANYWLEAAIMMQSLKGLYPDRVFEMRYDQFTADPAPFIQSIFDFIGEDASGVGYKMRKIKPEKNKYKKLLTADDLEFANEICGDMAKAYGFDIGAAQSEIQADA